MTYEYYCKFMTYKQYCKYVHDLSSYHTLSFQRLLCVSPSLPPVSLFLAECLHCFYLYGLLIPSYTYQSL